MLTYSIFVTQPGVNSSPILQMKKLNPESLSYVPKEVPVSQLQLEVS